MQKEKIEGLSNDEAHRLTVESIEEALLLLLKE